MRKLAAAALALVLAGCSKKAEGPQYANCPDSPVKLTSWKRAPLQFWSASMLVPAESNVKKIPTEKGSYGERWGGSGFGVYYILDSVRTDHMVETGPQVTNMRTCVDTVDGIPGVITQLNSTATSISGEFGQATWTLPNGKTLFVAVLTGPATARDSVLALLQSMRFEEK